jgi:hypothetical protein
MATAVAPLQQTWLHRHVRPLVPSENYKLLPPHQPQLCFVGAWSPSLLRSPHSLFFFSLFQRGAAAAPLSQAKAAQQAERCRPFEQL